MRALSYKHFLPCLIFCFVLNFKTAAQVSISGPTCVVPKVVYQYNIKTGGDSSTSIKVCFTGGMASDSTGSACISKKGPFAIITVKWIKPGAASLSVTSSKGNSTINISVTSQLTAGSINNAVVLQTIKYDSIPLTISCSVDTGGSCSPAYAYQWQQSFDMLGWTNLSGANSQNLTISSGLKQTTFYRRKVTETTSGSISYSNVATIDVIIPVPAAHSYINRSNSNLALKDKNILPGRCVNIPRQVFLKEEAQNKKTNTII
jgi:hypothetical protein